MMIDFENTSTDDVGAEKSQVTCAHALLTFLLNNFYIMMLALRSFSFYSHLRHVNAS